MRWMGTARELTRKAVVPTVVVLAFALAIVVVLVILGPLSWSVAGATVRQLGGKERADAINGVRQLLLGAVAGSAAAIGLGFTARTYFLARRGQVTDRYVKAVSLLASERSAERVGGVYALEHVMRESARDHQAIVDVLAAHIRERTPTDDGAEPPTDTAPEVGNRPRPPSDVQAALTVLGRRPDRPESHPIDLRRTDLRGAELASVRFASVLLTKAWLHRADLRNAQLTGSRLSGTVLYGADLRDADLAGAMMIRAKLPFATLNRASLHRATLTLADLTHAQLYGADLREAGLNSALLPSANLRRARLQGAKAAKAILAGANLSKSDLTDADLNGADLRAALLTSAEARGAKLIRAKLQGAKLGQASLAGSDLTRADLSGAHLGGTALDAARLAGTDLSGAPNLKRDQLQRAQWSAAEPPVVGPGRRRWLQRDDPHPSTPDPSTGPEPAAGTRAAPR